MLGGLQMGRGYSPGSTESTGIDRADVVRLGQLRRRTVQYRDRGDTALFNSYRRSAVD